VNSNIFIDLHRIVLLYFVNTIALFLMLIGFYWLTMTANRSNNISVFIQYSPYPPWRNNNENCRPGLDIQLRLISGQFSELPRLLVGQCDHFFANLVQHNSVTWPSIGQQTMETNLCRWISIVTHKRFHNVDCSPCPKQHSILHFTSLLLNAKNNGYSSSCN